MFKGFRDFLMRGNVLDLAVAVIIGAAFSAVVNSFVADIITPFIGAIVGQPDFSAITLGPLQLGAFLNALLSFIIMAAVVYFLVVVPINRVMERMQRQPAAVSPPAPTREETLLAEIRDLLKRDQAS